MAKERSDEAIQTWGVAGPRLDRFVASLPRDDDVGSTHAIGCRLNLCVLNLIARLKFEYSLRK
jgi:hypothetical protein